MFVDAKIPFLIAVLLLSTRFSMVFLMSPLFAMGRVPVKFRLILLISLSLLLVSLGAASDMPDAYTLGMLTQLMLAELVLGGMLAFGIFTAFAAFQFGGRVIDLQMGFGVAGLVDPSTNTQSPLIGTSLNLMGVIAFFLLDGHHLVLQGLALSVEAIPPGSTLVLPDGQAVLAQFGVMFSLGFALVAPVIITLLLIDVAMAVGARTMPQVNMFIMSFPVKIFVGLTVLAVSINYMGGMLERIYTSIFDFWSAVIG